MDKHYPLILVFYLDRELMKDKRIIAPFTEAVNKMLHDKQANALAFFLPTDGEEFIDCINPVMIKEADMEHINQIMEDIKKNFSINPEMKLPLEEITPDMPEKFYDVPDTRKQIKNKDCTCEGGECNCN